MDLEVRYEAGQMFLLSVKDFNFTPAPENKPLLLYSNAHPTDTWKNYNLLKISSKSEIAKALKPNKTITLSYKNSNYEVKMHSSIPGRIDGLSTLYRDHPELPKSKTVHFLFYSDTYKIVIKTKLPCEDAISILETRGELTAVTLLKDYVEQRKNTIGWDGHFRNFFPQISSEFKLHH